MSDGLREDVMLARCGPSGMARVKNDRSGHQTWRDSASLPYTTSKVIHASCRVDNDS